MESVLVRFSMVMPIAFFGIFIAIVIVSIVYNSRRKKEYLRDLSLTLEGAEIGGFVPVFLMGVYKGKRIKVELHSSRGKNSPPYIYIHLFTETPFSFNIYKEGIFQKLGKKIGLVSEIEIGIPDFDEKFVIKSGQGERVKQYLMNEMVRKIIDSIIKTGFSSINVSNGEILLIKTSYNMSAEVKPAFIHPVLDGLIVMSQTF